MEDFKITVAEKEYLRDLAQKYMEYAKLAVMEERRRLWYNHNALTSERPVIVMEMDTFIGDMLPEPRCSSTAARQIERYLMYHIVNHEMIDDDKVIPPYYTVNWCIDLDEFGVDIPKEHAADSHGRTIGYKWEHPIKKFRRDLELLESSTFRADRERTMAWKDFVGEILGDSMPVRIKNNSLRWYAAPSGKAVRLMGLEKMMLAMMDEPDAFHRFFGFLRDDILAFIDWQEKEGLLTLNNGNDYCGAGSYGFTAELPQEDFDGQVRPRDLWLNMNSQETVGISPAMFGEFIFPYYRDIASRFGLLYFGCCEPVDQIWDHVSRLPGLKKVSVSPWCSQEFMGEALQDTGIIFSRKPSPNFIGVGTSLDEEGFRAHMKETLRAASGLTLEIIFRDIYTVSGEPTKPKRAVNITRELIESIW